MIGELPAYQARSFWENHQQLVCEKWYTSWKYDFYDKVQKTALKGKRDIQLSPDEWNQDDMHQAYLEKQLIRLGYQVNRDQENMVISW